MILNKDQMAFALRQLERANDAVARINNLREEGWITGDALLKEKQMAEACIRALAQDIYDTDRKALRELT